MVREATFLAAALLGVCLASCGGEVNVGSSQLELTDGGSDDAGSVDADAVAPDTGAAPLSPDDRLARVAEGMEGVWTAEISESVVTLSFKSEWPRGGRWTLKDCVSTTGQPCSNNNAFPADAGIPFPLEVLSKLLIVTNGEYWLHRFYDPPSYRFVSGTFTFGAGFEFLFDAVKQEILVAGGLVTFKRKE